MSGWIPTPSDGWAEIAEALSATGRAWPESAAVTDLRWYVDAAAHRLGVSERRRDDVTRADHDAIRAALPGRPALAKRWGWTDWAVKQLLRRPEAWWDAQRWGAQDVSMPDSASPPPARRQPAASPPPAPEPSDADNWPPAASPPPARRQPAASGPPSRVPSSPQTHNPTTPQDLVPPAAEPPGEPAADPTPSDPDQLAERVRTAALLWGLQALPAQGRKPSNGPERGKLLDKLRTSCRQDYEATLDAIRFAAESQHSRAVYLREQRYDLDTVLRHRESYAALWREFGARPEARASPAAARPPPRGRSTLGDGVLDRLFAENQATKRRIDEYET